MKFSINWLKTFVDIDCSVEKLADNLTFAGLEVEEIIEQGGTLHQIVTGQIKTIEKHPDADRLVICQISDGSTMHQILTAATNVFEGAIIPMSLPGSVLASGLKIKSTKMRGIDSHGMLCSETELGLSDDAEGIMILPEDTPLGVDFVEHAQLKDTILDVAILPNRGDCQSVFGLAREIATLLNVTLKPLEINPTVTAKKSPIKVNLAAKELCPLYTIRYLSGAKLNPTPQWMAARLQSGGIRPINLLVDITNYVLLEMGQPLHAFDLNSLNASEMTVRTAKKDEKITTLDDQEKTCNENTLLIAIGESPVAIAGIMGGQGSQITDSSQDIILEAAYFDPTFTRRAATQHQSRTESAMRFEKGVDIEGVIQASDRAAQLYQDLAGATVHDLVVEKNEAHPIFADNVQAFYGEKINGLLGSSFSEADMISTLSGLGFSFSDYNTKVKVPSWRKRDIEAMPCLAEEILRIKGVESIPFNEPTLPGMMETESKGHRLYKMIQNSFIQKGFFEVNSYPMMDEKDNAHFKIENPININNPISTDLASMRGVLLPSLLKIMSFNLHRQQSHVFLMEIGKVFKEVDGKITEETIATAIATGPITTGENSLNKNTLNFASLKGILESILARFKGHDLEISDCPHHYLHPIKSLSYLQNESEIAHVGFCHPSTTAQYSITQDVGVIMINLSKFEALISTDVQHFSPISKFPSSKRDIAILAPKSLSYKDISQAISDNKARTLKEVTLFDVFEDESLGEDKKSLAFSCTYQAQDRTLSDEDVNKAHARLCKKIKESLPISIR